MKSVALLNFFFCAAVIVQAKEDKRLKNRLGVKYGINPDSMISYDSIYFGYAPDWYQPVTMAELNQATGQKGATYNVYSQIRSDNVESGSYDGNDQWNVDDIISSGAVLIASLMPNVSSWTDITPELCESVASFFENTFTSQGTTVWLRYAHEVNWYTTAASGPEYPGGTDYAAFITSWKNMYNAVSGNDKIYMYWSPNVDTSSEPVSPWWPGKEYTDIVGLDYYPSADDGLPDFATAYGSFIETYAIPNRLPFAIGETGTILSNQGSASVAQREQWLKNILNPDQGFGSYSQYYISCTWFEYGPPGNPTFWVVYDQSTSTISETISNTENGSA